jgi:catalase
LTYESEGGRHPRASLTPSSRNSPTAVQPCWLVNCRHVSYCTPRDVPSPCSSVEQGKLRRVRSATFADHFSQARQFYISQTPIEQAHIINAFVFELSKCEQLPIRTRMVANLRNVDENFAMRVANGLGLDELPDASTPVREPIIDLPPSDALSIQKNGPASFAGRKVGALVTNGSDR